MALPSHPLFRSLLTLVIFGLAMHVLKSAWNGKGSAQTPSHSAHSDRLVVAHFMVCRGKGCV